MFKFTNYFSICYCYKQPAIWYLLLIRYTFSIWGLAVCRNKFWCAKYKFRKGTLFLHQRINNGTLLWYEVSAIS
jgi:hypothetical protein